MRIFALCLLAASNAAAVPVVVQHQGRLLDGEDHPVTGALEFVFTLHEVQTDPDLNPPAPVWTRTYTISVTGGVYTVALGAGGAGDALDTSLFDTDTPLYLQVKVAGQVMSPRLLVGSVPYAFFAARAAVAHDVDCAGACISGAELEDGSITLAKLSGGGSISGLDADKLDGKDSADFVHNTETPQTGAKFSVQGGAVAGTLSAGTLTAGTLTVGSDFTANGSVDGTGFSGWDMDAFDDLTTATTFAGDVTGNSGATVVGDDSHAHTDAFVANDLSIDNGRLFAPAGAGNVGIGTTSPIEKVTIQGNLFLNAAGADAGLRIQNGTGNSFWVNSPTTALMSIGGTGNALPAAGALNITSGGTVGIGTAAPAAPLHILGQATDHYLLRVERPVNTAGSGISIGFAQKNSTGNSFIFSEVMGAAEDVTAGSEDGRLVFAVKKDGARIDPMVITRDGNVGIGTTSPQAGLHLQSPGDVTLALWSGAGQRQATITYKTNNLQADDGQLIISNPDRALVLKTAGMVMDRTPAGDLVFNEIVTKVLGATTNSYNGRITFTHPTTGKKYYGRAATTAICQNDFGAGARMCDLYDLMRMMQANAIKPVATDFAPDVPATASTLPTVGTWINTGQLRVSRGSTNDLYSDCFNWSGQFAPNGSYTAMYYVPPSYNWPYGYTEPDNCSSSNKLMCCR